MFNFCSAPTQNTPASISNRSISPKGPLGYIATTELQPQQQQAAQAAQSMEKSKVVSASVAMMDNANIVTTISTKTESAQSDLQNNCQSSSNNNGDNQYLLENGQHASNEEIKEALQLLQAFKKLQMKDAGGSSQQKSAASEQDRIQVQFAGMDYFLVKKGVFEQAQAASAASNQQQDQTKHQPLQPQVSAGLEEPNSVTTSQQKQPEQQSSPTKLSKKKKKPKITIKKNDGESQNDTAATEQAQANSISQGQFNLLREEIELLKQDKESQKNQIEKLKKKVQEHKNTIEENQRARNKNSLDIAFVYASPRYVQFQAKPWDLLQFDLEGQGIKESIKSSEKSIKFKATLGTMENFKKIVSLHPQILHLTCHGEYDTDKSKGVLIFETENGEGAVIKQDDLLTQKDRLKQIKLIFIAACKSDRIGKVLQREGVRHVICSQQDMSLVDETTVKFTNSLYTKILQGESICNAFYNAKDEVKQSTGDQKVEKFQLIQNNHSKGDCISYWQGEEGAMVCKSEHIKFKHISKCMDDFIERDNDQFKPLLAKLTDNKCTKICFHGYAGLGKTYIIRNMIHYIEERKFFTGGLIYLNIGGQSQVDQFQKLLFQYALQFFKLTHEQKKHFRQEKNDSDSVLKFLIDFFNCRYGKKRNNDYQLARKDHKHFEEEHERGKRFLLVLDNSQNIIQSSVEKFKNLLDQFLDNCQFLTILVVTRNPLTGFSPVELKKIQSTKESINFFELKIEQGVKDYAKSPKISLDEETVDLLINTPLKNLKTDKLKKINMKSTDEAKAELKNILKLNGNKARMELLEQHQLFEYLNGNPTSLIQAANCYLHEINKREEVGKLYSIYKLMQDCLERFGDYETKLNKSRLAEQDKIRNDFSLEVATRMTLTMIPKDQSDSMNLLYFLGCLPGGINEENLEILWPQIGREDQQLCLSTLKDLHLIYEKEKKKNNGTQVELRFNMQNLIREFTQQDLNDDTKKQFMMIIIDFFVTRFKREYNNILSQSLGKDDEDSEDDIADMKLDHQQSKQIRSLVSLSRDFVSAVGNVEEDIFNDLTGIFQEKENMYYCIQYIMEMEQLSISNVAKHLHHFDKKPKLKSSLKPNQDPQQKKKQVSFGTPAETEEVKQSPKNSPKDSPQNAIQPRKSIENRATSKLQNAFKRTQTQRQPQNKKRGNLEESSSSSDLEDSPPRTGPMGISIGNLETIKEVPEELKCNSIVSVPSVAEKDDSQAKVVDTLQTQTSETLNPRESIEPLIVPEKMEKGGSHTPTVHATLEVGSATASAPATGGGGKIIRKKKKEKKHQIRSEIVKLNPSIKLSLFCSKSFTAKNLPTNNAQQSRGENFDDLVDAPQSESSMTKYEQFIIYCVSIAVLTQRYDDAYKVASQQFKSDDICFKSNKLRLLCLAAESIYLKYFRMLDSRDEDYDVNINMVDIFLLDAIIANRLMEKLLQEQDDPNTFCQSRGLCALQYGLFLWKHAEKISEQAFKSKFDSYLKEKATMDRIKNKQINFSIENRQDCFKQAHAQLKHAYEEFKKISDLKAMEIVKIKEVKLLKSNEFKSENILSEDERFQLRVKVSDEIQQIRQEQEEKLMAGNQSYHEEIRNDSQLIAQVLIHDQVEPISPSFGAFRTYE